LTWADIVDGTTYIATSKNDDPRTVLLRHDLHILLETRRKPEGRVFRFRQGGHLKDLLKRCTLAVCGLPPPPRWKKGEKRRLAPHRLVFVNFHVLCHTWATWMRRYGGADLQGLVATNRWRDPRSARRAMLTSWLMKNGEGSKSCPPCRSPAVENLWSQPDTRASY
jgi:integrase